MMRPWFCAIIVDMAAVVQKYTLLRLVLITSVQSSSVSLRIDQSRVMPALLTMLVQSAPLIDHALHHAACLVLVADVGLHQHGVAAQRTNLVSNSLCFSLAER